MNAPIRASRPLYCFSASMLGAGLAMESLVADPCKLLTGTDNECNSTERVLSTCMAGGFLYVGVLFSVLTHLNRANAPKLKALSIFVATCVIMSLTGVIMTGSSRLGGFERDIFHICDMIFFFALFVVLVMAIGDDAPFAKRQSPLVGLGVNSKSVVLLGVIAILVELFIITDMLPYSYFLEDPVIDTDLARVMWGWQAISTFEILLGSVFALAYGDAKDQDAVALTFVGMTIVGLASIVPISHKIKADFLEHSFTRDAIVVGICVVGLTGGRLTKTKGL
jgi:hypothetical protein